MDEVNSEKNADEVFCHSCGQIIKKEAEICPKCGVRQRSVSISFNKRVTAGILAILLGSFGVHKFYMGSTGLGILYLCFFWTGLPGIAGLIEGALMLARTDKEFETRYG